MGAVMTECQFPWIPWERTSLWDSRWDGNRCCRNLVKQMLFGWCLVAILVLLSAQLGHIMPQLFQTCQFKVRGNTDNNTNNIHNTLFNLIFVDITSWTPYRFHQRVFLANPLASTDNTRRTTKKKEHQKKQI